MFNYNVVTCAWDNFPPNEQTINVLAMKLMKHESLVKMQNENHVAYVNKTFFSQSSRKMKDVKGKEKKKGDSNYIKKTKEENKDGNVFISTNTDGVIDNVVIAKILYIPNLRQNLFLVCQIANNEVMTCLVKTHS
jgi:hypothetical protein